MKTTILVLMAAVTLVSPYAVMAENNGEVTPPPGPYRSMDKDAQYHIPDQNPQSAQQGRNMPEWAMQRSDQMRQWMNQSNMPARQVFNNQRPQWNYQQAPQRPMQYPARNPGFQANRQQQFYPAPRAYMYEPSAQPPPEFYRQPAYPAPRY